MIETAAQVAPEGIDLAALLGKSPDEIVGMSDDQIRQEASWRLEQLEQEEAEAARQAAEARQNRVTALGQKLKAEFDRRVTLRQTIELRWLSDLRRYNGQYEPAFLQQLQNRKYGSTMFVPLTRRVCNIVEARLGDLLYPTEDRNFAITSSPVPELAEAELLANRLKPDTMLELPAGIVSPDTPGGVPRDNGGMRIPASQVRMAIAEVRGEAMKAAEAMQREVDDQLRQSNYGKVGREVIHDGIVFGTGVMKGPMVLNRLKKSWKVLDGVAKLSMVEDLSPVAVRVNPWDFYPDMSARTLAESESEYERHYLNKADMAALAKQPGFDREALKLVLANEAPLVQDFNRDAMREASGTQGVQDKRYQLIEYHGPIDHEDLCACLEKTGRQSPEEALDVYNGVVFFTPDGIVVKALVNPMGTGERPYSVWSWQKDAGSIFGFGLPYECADLQDVANSSFRAAMDNLGLAVGPQIVVNSKIMRPHNGDWTITPNKIWELLKADGDARMAFAFFQIEGRITELLAVFNGAKALLDEIAGPQLAMQGQEATNVPRTDFQASMQYNASNIWMRRAVRHWDDDITSTVVQRFVDWNMEHNPKKEIKGDVFVMARGTSALLEAEGQVQRIGWFMALAKDIPMPYKKRIAQLRTMATATRLDPVDILPDDAEIEKIAAQVDNAVAPPNPEIERIKLRQAEIQDKEKDRMHNWAVEKARLVVRMAEIASREGLTRDAAEQKYQIDLAQLEQMALDRTEKAADRAQKAQMFNAEAAIKAAAGEGI